MAVGGNDPSLWGAGTILVEGPPGPPPTMGIGTVTQATEAQVTITTVGAGSYLLNFWLPRGEQGTPGANGVPGDPGEMAALIGVTVTTLPAGSSATADLVGSPGSQVLELGIPAGPQGDPGETGDPGVSPAWLTGETEPDDELGVPGDYYIRSTTGEWWGPKTEVWGDPSGNLRGPAGPDGEDGEDGAPGVVQAIDSDAFLVVDSSDPTTPVISLASGYAEALDNLLTVGLLDPQTATLEELINALQGN